MVNIEFLIVAYIIGMFIDWIFQWKWQSSNKSNWNKEDNKMLSFYAVYRHSFIYAIMTMTISLYLINDFSNGIVVFLVLFLSHIIIDTRIIVKYIMRFKMMSWDEIYDYKNYGFMHIGIDHRLHEIVLIVLSIYI